MSDNGEPGLPAPEPPLFGRSRAELTRWLLEWISNGGTVLAFSRQAGAPNVTTIYKWLGEDPLLQQDFAKARAIGFDVLSQQCLDIADDVEGDSTKDRQLMIQTRLQLLARWDTARYGERLQVEGINAASMTDEQAMAKVLELLAIAKKRQLREHRIEENEARN